MSRKDVLWMVGSAGAVLLALSLVRGTGFPLKGRHQEAGASWKQGTISAGYIGCQLKEIDKGHSSLIISYELENNTDRDYRLAEGPGLVILGRLKSDGSYSQEQPVRLGYPVFLPARQHARLAVEMTQPFAWPAANDPASLDKMRKFVMQRLENVEEFVVFDEVSHWQLELPSGWEGLEDASQPRD